jgi:hypothetical protein
MDRHLGNFLSFLPDVSVFVLRVPLPWYEVLCHDATFCALALSFLLGLKVFAMIKKFFTRVKSFVPWSEFLNHSVKLLSFSFLWVQT